MRHLLSPDDESEVLVSRVRPEGACEQDGALRLERDAVEVFMLNLSAPPEPASRGALFWSGRCHGLLTTTRQSRYFRMCWCADA
jgi:hypothetical protein